MSIDLERPGGTPVRVTGSAIRLSATPPTYDIRPPLLGEHNKEVLGSFWGSTRRRSTNWRRTRPFSQESIKQLIIFRHDLIIYTPAS